MSIRQAVSTDLETVKNPKYTRTTIRWERWSFSLSIIMKRIFLVISGRIWCFCVLMQKNISWGQSR